MFGDEIDVKVLMKFDRERNAFLLGLSKKKKKGLGRKRSDGSA